MSSRTDVALEACWKWLKTAECECDSYMGFTCGLHALRSKVEDAMKERGLPV